MSMLILSWCLLGTGIIMLGCALYAEDCRDRRTSRRASRRTAVRHSPEATLVVIVLGSALISSIGILSVAVFFIVKGIF